MADPTDQPASGEPARDPADQSASGGPARDAGSTPRRRPEPLAVVTLLAVAAYALVGIGSPLLGLKVFAATDLLTQVSPYRDSGLAGTVIQNLYLNDTIDSYLPNTALFVSALYDGQFAAWNPYIIGGTPLGATPNLGLLNPIALPYLLLPIWLAPGYVKLLEICFAVAGTFLFLRRLGLGRPAALLGGLVFAGSGFMVAWTNWPHTRVAALIPWLFWALERLVVRRRVTDGVLVALVTAGMILGGFPAVAGYGLLLGAGYLVVRGLAEYPRQWRRLAGVGVGAAGAVLAGVLLTAVQLAPFLSYMSEAYVNGREQTPEDHLSPASLVTAVAPWALGSTDPSRPPFWYLPANLVESLSYVGAAAMVLAVAAVAMPRAGQAITPRGAWLYLVTAAGALLVVVYVGRLPLLVLQQLPVLFSENFVGRARSVLGLLLAALAAIGFEVLLRLRGDHRAARRIHWYPVAVWAGAGLGGAGLWWFARRKAYEVSAARGESPAERVSHLDGEMLVGVGLIMVAGALVAALWWVGGQACETRGARVVRLTAAGLLPLLVAGQALTLAVPYWPRVDRDTFYPVTDTHRWLAGHLGHERFAGSGGGMYVGADSAHRLRALTGHFFLNVRFAETIDGLPGRQFGDPPTYVNFPVARDIVTHPVLDRLAVRYFVAPTGAEVLGTVVPTEFDDSEVAFVPGRPVTVAVGGGGPLRGVALIPAAPFGGGSPARLELAVSDSSGRQVARTERLVYDVTPGRPFWIAVPAEDVWPGEPLTARLTLHADEPLRVAGAAGAPGTPAMVTVAPADDGLRVAYAGDTVIYERLRALPRIRWASRVRVEPDPRRRVSLLTSGDLASDEVVLDAAPGDAWDGAGNGAPADLAVIQDGTDSVGVRVDAASPGHLVIADALQQDWAATVDGEPVDLVPADHGLVAVPVPSGEHEVRVAYRMPYRNVGALLSVLTATVLLVLPGVEWWRHRSGRPPDQRRGRRARLPADTPGG